MNRVSAHSLNESCGVAGFWQQCGVFWQQGLRRLEVANKMTKASNTRTYTSWDTCGSFNCCTDITGFLHQVLERWEVPARRAAAPQNLHLPHQVLRTSVHVSTSTPPSYIYPTKSYLHLPHQVLRTSVHVVVWVDVCVALCVAVCVVACVAVYVVV